MAGDHAADDPKSGGDDPGGDALRQLQIGNARFLCGKADHPRTDADRREETFKGGQHPQAIFLSCADSRVPVEVIFDQGVGDVFVVRVAGNVSDKHEAGSIEYAVEHLKAPLLVIMGHRGCGAVGAAVSKANVEGNVESIVESIRPAVDRAEKANPGLKGDGLLAEAVRYNVYNSIETLLKSSPMLTQMVKSKKLMVVGAIYDIETGTVNWLGKHPDESRLISGEATARDDGKESKDGKDAKEGEKPGKTAVAGATATPGGEKGKTEPAKPKGPNPAPAPQPSGGGHHP